MSRQSSPGSSYYTCITQRRQLDTDLPDSLSKLHEARFVFWHAASKLVFLSIFLPSLSFLVKNSHAFDDSLDLLDFHFGHFEKNTCSLKFVLQKVSNCLYKDQQHQVNNFQNGNTLLDAKTITLYINRNDNALYVIIHHYGFIMTTHCDKTSVTYYDLLPLFWGFEINNKPFVIWTFSGAPFWV